MTGIKIIIILNANLPDTLQAQNMGADHNKRCFYWLCFTI